MEDKTRNIENLSVAEREEILIDAARTLEGAAQEAMVEGDQKFAAFSINMAEAIRINADELAREDLESADQVLQQAAEVISQFKATHPYPMISTAVH
ncbi:hypothetical protein HGP17_13095 [Rhizobium sp. P38BS-XIX]|uniref:hypothetical protein n=1 Tax=Rhizobium sp. P38BS-XIX TaxID=2726740 RepID=UPI0014571E5D|nr:hypothetical protein [Rhizobium sp. P38BS-XIX]NLR97747.1 hypothetical protein [Rhizobium sp. P38BS-XIX]